jgi:peptidylprolyl isomerase domain and WD repeat-containing protein 1
MSSSDDEVGPRIPQSKKRVVESSDDEVVGPLPPKKTVIIHTLPSELPSAELYEFSLTESDPIIRIHGSSLNDFIISCAGSLVKFWKREFGRIEFVKAFNLGSHIVDSVLYPPSGSELAVLTRDNYLRVFDVVNFNMYGMVKLGPPFSDEKSVLVFGESADVLGITRGSEVIFFKIAALLDDPKRYSPVTKSGVHSATITQIVFSPKISGYVSVDSEGFVEISGKVEFQSKFDTDLFELKKNNDQCVSLVTNPSGSLFAIMTTSGHIKIFRTANGKLVKSIDESLDSLSVAQNDPLQAVIHIPADDFAQRIGREMEDTERRWNKHMLTFDESGEHLVYSTLVGIKVVNFLQNKLVGLLGKLERTERFLDLVVLQGAPKLRKSDSTGDQKDMYILDPWIIATDGKKAFIFTNRLPSEKSRDMARGNI